MIRGEVIRGVCAGAQPRVQDGIVAGWDIMSICRAAGIDHLLEQSTHIEGGFRGSVIAGDLLIALVIRVVEELTGIAAIGNVAGLVVTGPGIGITVATAVAAVLRGHIAVGVVAIPAIVRALGISSYGVGL